MPTHSHQSWSSIDMHTAVKEDSLLSCLVLLTRFYRSPYSPQTLISGLPLENNKLTLKAFERAAQRASLETNCRQLPLDDIPNDHLPVIILLQDDTSRLLILDDNNNRKIIHPLSLEVPSELKNIESMYTGHYIQLKPQYKHTDRAKDTLNKQGKDWFWPVLFKSWPIYSEVVIASLLINLFAMVLPLFTMNVYDRVVPNQAIITMWILASGVMIVFLFDLLLKSLRAYFIDVTCKRSDEILSAHIFEHILAIELLRRPKSVGVFANTVQSFEVFREFITSSTITLLVDLPFVFLFIFVIYCIGGGLFWVPFLIMPIIVLIGFLLQAPLIKLTRESYQFAAEKQATLYDSLANIDTVKTTGAESTLQSRWEQIIKLSSATGMKLRFISSMSMQLTALLQQSASVGVVILGVYQISEGNLSVGALIACTILTSRALAPMSQVAALFTRYHQSVNALRSLNNLMQMPTDINEATNYLHRPNLKGDIACQGVSFHYQDKTLPILKNVNIKINAGEKVGIIGRVGSGKSTLAKLLTRLYVPSEGTIIMDGTDYRQINPSELRQQIGYVPQDVTLLYGTIRENILMGSPFIKDEHLIKATDIAGIGAFTNCHPLGLDRQVGEKGNDLSGGQRQAVGIARALLRSPKIIVLDEPTSAMDVTSEHHLKQRLRQHLTDDHTLILITHKMSMLDLVSRIIILDEGNVIADGPKQEIIAALHSGVSIQQEST